MVATAHPLESDAEHRHDADAGHPAGQHDGDGTIAEAGDKVALALDAMNRRTFMMLMGATAVGATQLGACTKPQALEKIVPYVRSPEHVVPGMPSYYASRLPTHGFASGYGRGIVAESHEGRPTKIEGNTLHPSSLGGTDVFMQAAILQLYDRDRSKSPLFKGQNIGWGAAMGTITDFIAHHGGARDIRIGLLTGTVTSPTMAAQIQQLATEFPNLQWFVEDALTGARSGQVSALGRRVTPVHNFANARRIVSLDAHFLAEGPGALRYAREYSAGRRLPRDGSAPHDGQTMSRLYVAECSSTFTGALADHRLAVTPSLMPKVAAALLTKMLDRPIGNSLPGPIARWIAAAADDLAAYREQSLVIAGDHQPAEVHAAAYAINALLGAPSHTVDYRASVDELPIGDHSLAPLAKAMESGDLDLLILFDVNPAYTAPGEMAFADALRKFSEKDEHLSVHVGGYVDETALHCNVHFPLSHALESWSDIRGHDGTAAIIQPLIEPLWNTRSAVEMLAALVAIGQPVRSLPATDYELVRAAWFGTWKDNAVDDREMRWRRSLRDGFVEGSQAPAATNLRTPDAGAILKSLEALPVAPADSIELVFRPDPTIADGSFANHPWLQELPKPLSRVTWGNVALLGPATATALGVTRPGDVSRREVPLVKIQANGKEIEIPAWVVPGHPENAVTLHLGGGRSAPAGGMQEGVGVDVGLLRTTANPWSAAIPVAQIQTTGRGIVVAAAQAIESQSGRDISRTREVDRFPFVSGEKETAVSVAATANAKPNRLSLYEDYRYAGYRWGMVVDLTCCIGCNACVVACQAENNVPTVGREQVIKGREMHWLRIDTYFDAATSDASQTPGTRFMPMLCQHCENAPCELVCPVEATSHSNEGINEMTYNRCVGTRYCSNNCPYKVRRFNFLHYTARETEGDPGEVQALQRNPNVTVRYRGVMEKCTYCIQRINRGRIEAKRQWAKNAQSPHIYPAPPMRTPVQAKWIAGGKAEELPRLNIVTACAQACPTEAIIFGDLNDADALAGKLKTQMPWRAVNYGVLDELNTQPRTSYLERITNPNPVLVAKGKTA